MRSVTFATVATRAAAACAGLESLFTCDLGSIPAVQAFVEAGGGGANAPPTAAACAALLPILSSGAPTDVDAWWKKHSAAEAELGLEHAALLQKVRHMALSGAVVAALATKDTGNGCQLGYDDLRTTLCLGAIRGSGSDAADLEIEKWMVLAVGLKLIDVRLDRVARVAKVTRGTIRAFGDAEWKRLRQDFQSWESSLEK